MAGCLCADPRRDLLDAAARLRQLLRLRGKQIEDLGRDAAVVRIVAPACCHPQQLCESQEKPLVWLSFSSCSMNPELE